ncbi:MAG TPA: hypothetical protein VGC79_35345 [Polyangiaceae bacterium]
MSNPFEKRATEYLRDDEAAFLSLISPEPLRTYLAAEANKGHLFERLMCIIGTPGSGKTTIATLLESRMVEAVLADREKDGYKDIISALDACKVVERGEQKIAAVRLPMEGEYRDFWELPYDEALRTRLVLAIIQARAVLGLVRNLTQRHAVHDIRFVPRADAEAALAQIGGGATDALLERAREVERAVYDIGARLVPPKVEGLAESAVRPFRPFDVIEAVEITYPDGSKKSLKPLVILDDAHTLHPRQFALVFRDLARREIRIGRWIMMRLDTLTPATSLGKSGNALEPELKLNRDYSEVFLNRPKDRLKARNSFRSMARSMADRYLRRHPTFERRQYRHFAPLLSTQPDTLAKQTQEKLAGEIEKTAARLHISKSRVSDLRAEVARYATSALNQDVGADVQAAMLNILLHRYSKRVPQKSLFEGEGDPAPRQSVTADAGVAEGARVHLRHAEGRALHYGLQSVSDASTENAELFLHLSAALVNRMETRLINGDQPELPSRVQDRILQERAERIISNWSFPYADKVRLMLGGMAKDCIAESLLPNAPLEGGANAVGIPQQEFEALLAVSTPLSQVLHFATAYNAITIQPEYGQGNKLWCLIELGGPVILANSLTLRRGGFLERQVADLNRYAGLGTP